MNALLKKLPFFLCIIATDVSALQSDDYMYEVSSYDTNTVIITGYTGPGGDLLIPSLIDGKTVTIIGDDAFRGNDTLTTVTIPNTVDRINESAFYACNNLAHVFIPESVSVIENFAFYVCRNLTAITVDTNNTMYESVDGVLFRKGSVVWLVQYPGGKIGSYTVPNGVGIIADYAFTACSGLTDITIPAGVYYIGQRAFWQCYSLNSATLPTTVTHIGEGAFWNCHSLTSITVPSGVTTIRSSTFSNCGSLTNITFSGVVTVIGDNAFSDCTQLPMITFPDGLTTIGYRSFDNCPNLATLEFPGTVTSIGSSSFSGCGGLTVIRFEGNAPSEGSYPAFYGANHAIVYYVPSTSGWSSTFGGRPTTPGPPFPGFLHTVAGGMCTITFYTGTNSEVLIPDIINGLPVSAIGNAAFSENPGLTGITVHQGITNIGSQAFSSCINLMAITVDTNNPAYCDVDGVLFNQSQTTLIQFPGGRNGTYSIPVGVTAIAPAAFKKTIGLTDITLPDGITSIGSSAFESCSGLTDVTLPSGISTIEPSTFRSCTNLKNVTVPATVTSIGNYAFAFSTDLMSVHFRGNLPSSGSHVFWDNNTAIIYYVHGTDGWEDTFNGLQTELWWMGSYVITNGTVTITGYENPDAHMIIPDTVDGMPVTSIADSAFTSQANLTSVIISANVTNIGSLAFGSCTNLTTFYILGNAPSQGLDIFLDNDTATVYYMPGTAGWGTTFGGLPAVLWYLQAQDFEVTPDYVAFTINGTSNRTFVIKASADLKSADWIPLETNTLSTGSIRFLDSRTPNHTACFYCLSPQ